MPRHRHGPAGQLTSYSDPELSKYLRTSFAKSMGYKEDRAVVFDSPDDVAARIDDPQLDVGPDDFLVMRNAGPASQSAMPEVGYLPIPEKPAQERVGDMGWISHARMSGTAFGTVILHVAPEAAIGGPPALVRNGDRVRLSMARLRLDLVVDDRELASRRVMLERSSKDEDAGRGYGQLHVREIMQADTGCDFRFMRPAGLAG